MIKNTAKRSYENKILALFFTVALLTAMPLHNLSAQPPQCTGDWHTARLTNYASYPAPDSEECVTYNGCAWTGQFYGLPDRKMSESWVREHNIVAVHMKDWRWLGLKMLKLRQGRKEILVRVLDACADADCDGCCTKNLGTQNHLIDIEKYTMQRFGAGDGIVEFQVCR